MAVCTLVPFPPVLSAVNGEIRLIVLCKIRSIPAGIGGMASGAIGRKVPRFVVRAGSRPEIRFVTGKTIRRRIDKIPTDMTLGAVVNLVPFGQWEKQVVGSSRYPEPFIGGHVVTSHTVGRKTRRQVVGGGCCLVSIAVAVDTIVANAVKLQTRFRYMTVDATRCIVPSQQRKPVFHMQLGNIIHQPIVCVVTAGTVHAYRLLVYIDVAGKAVRSGFRKNQGFMASPAIYVGMLSRQFKSSFTMVKTHIIWTRTGNLRISRSNGFPVISPNTPALW